MQNQDQHSLANVFAGALKAITLRIAGLNQYSDNTSEADQTKSIAIAYSGGLDSTVLLHLAVAYAKEKGMSLCAFHIHHGLSPNADQWLEHCRQTCAQLGVVFDARQVGVDHKDCGIEEAARIARYAALGSLCAKHDVSLLLTAHHLDDQAETVFLQLLRGSGVAGMSGMDIANRAPTMLGNATLVMARPLLSVSRLELEAYAKTENLVHVDDESNQDPRYARNALRHQVLPALAACFPGFQQRFARTAQHSQSAQRLLIELATQDFAACRVDDALDIAQLRLLSADRADNLLRYWFGLRGMRMPSTSWLHEMRAQLFEAKADAQLCVTHPDCHIRRHRDKVFITSRAADNLPTPESILFNWAGEAFLSFPAFGGRLLFDIGDAGIDVDWLQRQRCEIHYRRSGERLKLAANRPTKSLKYHYQAMDIPAWEREYLPIVSTGGKLLFAAGLGMDSMQFGNGGVARVQIRWQRDSV